MQKSQSSEPIRILIVGGGTAGWMSALMLQAQLQHPTQITLIESDTIGTIGVGEGTTPYIRDFFRQVGIAESDWMDACDATYKCGIRFPNWSTVKGYESYYHPFYSSYDLAHGDDFFELANQRRRGQAVAAQPDPFFLASYLSSQGKSPLLPEGSNASLDYAYHFDAGKLGNYMRDVAIQRGVKHCIGTVDHVRQSSNGTIASITTNDGQTISADVFVDCSGFAGLLIEKTLNVPLLPFSDNLLNNAAVAIQTQYCDDRVIPTETRSEALQHGWMWQIPLQSRQGNGYVYSEQHCSADEAESTLRRQLGVDDSVAARHLKMRVGRRREHLYANCMAIGLSQGFIEPLEATALMLVQFSLQQFIQQLNANGLAVNQSAAAHDSVNTRINNLIDGIRDYIVAHYKTNSRNDSEYWRINRYETPMSDRLAEILQTWEAGEPLEPVLDKHAAVLAYLRPSWYCLLAGSGYFKQHIDATSGDLHQKAQQYYAALAARF